MSLTDQTGGNGSPPGAPGGGSPAASHAWLEVDLDAIAHNARAIRALLPAGAQVMAVLKADGYGTGAVPVVRALMAEGVECAGVALVSEAVVLAGTAPASGCRPLRIFLMSPPLPGEIPLVVARGFEVGVHDLALAKALSAEAERQGRAVTVHLKVDTGMSRLGILPGEASRLVREMATLPGVILSGLYTHFPRADEEDSGETAAALGSFLEVAREIPGRPVCHVANSAVLLNLPRLISRADRDLALGMVRPGILLYGYAPCGRRSPLAVAFRPAVALRSRVLAVRHVPAGTPVGYGATYRTPAAGWLAVLSVGYGDGYPRRMSNRGQVLIDGRRFPVVGRVCMDHTIVFSGPYAPAPGATATLLGAQGRETVTMTEWEEWLDTIPHEILCRFTSRLPRRYLQGKTSIAPIQSEGEIPTSTR